MFVVFKAQTSTHTVRVPTGVIDPPSLRLVTTDADANFEGVMHGNPITSLQLANYKKVVALSKVNCSIQLI